MSIEYTYLNNNGILSKGYEKITGQEILNFNREIYSSPEKIKVIQYQLLDLSNVHEVDASTEDIISIAAQDRAAFAINPDMVIAIIAKQNLPYGLARMWDAYVDEPRFETSVFRSKEDAIAWLKEKIPNCTIQI